MWEEMGNGLHQDNQLNKEELQRTIIGGTIPTMIADTGASTTCIHPEEE
jgi:hypothetical protein